MAKEFKRSTAAASKGKKTIDRKREKGRNSEDAPSFKKRKDFRGRNEEAEEGKSREKKSTDSKKSEFKKNSDKSSFARYRDNARPSDFGTGRKRAAVNEEERKYSTDERSPKRKPDPEEGRFKRKDERTDSFQNEEHSFKRNEEERPSKRRSDPEDRGFKRKDVRTDFKKEGRSFKRNEDERPSKRKPDSEEGNSFKRKEAKGDFSNKKKSFPDKASYSKKEANPYDMDESDLEYGSEDRPKKKALAYEKKPYVKKGVSVKRKGESKPQREKDDGMIRLNKYISNAGICSRREADELIESGVVQVNGKTITEMGYRVKPSDIIKYGGQTLKKERMVYLVLNKPKDYITTVDDPQKRRTVLELVQNACKERIYPVGRLDRSTTGLLMFTNDGELTKKLTHPRYGVRKIYHVELDKPLKRQDLDQISEGLELEDGEIKVDEISYVGDGKDKTQIGVELHSGKNRIVRRIFEHFGYNVRKLDRVMFGSLTKKELPRGRWRFLTDAEVGILNMISAD